MEGGGMKRPIGKVLEKRLRKLQFQYNSTPEVQTIRRRDLLCKIEVVLGQIGFHFGRQEQAKARAIVLGPVEKPIDFTQANAAQRNTMNSQGSGKPVSPLAPGLSPLAEADGIRAPGFRL
jgi:hypothetical protein